MDNIQGFKVAYVSKTAFNGTTSVVKIEESSDGNRRKKTIRKGLTFQQADAEIDRLTKIIPIKRRLGL